MLLPPLCPVAKGKKVLFVFILEILDGDRTQPGSFWEVLKKHHCCHPIKLKKPEVSLTATWVTQAILKKLELVEEEAMTGVEPSAPADPSSPSLLPPPLSLLP